MGVDPAHVMALGEWPEVRLDTLWARMPPSLTVASVMWINHLGAGDGENDLEMLQLAGVGENEW
jgi:hypothetical protein